MEATRVPAVTGWSITSDGKNYTATKDRELSDYQRRWGALAEVQARTVGELWVLCDAQTRLAERLALAEAQRAVRPS
ncbi:hypothetical protein [Actinomadura viridis]|uniref:Uncharacterized protein n=1 Tax=Actinomadura viridis TaxID=58110 RepID=A0A931GTS8_9ACTN|nr:hypothetical protein [Actinomadura viridis]MBG6092359.1 hypothetical protein [Actinomadura viridis]